jgi:hypothetical protein
VRLLFSTMVSELRRLSIREGPDLLAGKNRSVGAPSLSARPLPGEGDLGLARAARQALAPGRGRLPELGVVRRKLEGLGLAGCLENEDDLPLGQEDVVAVERGVAELERRPGVEELARPGPRPP